MIDRCINTLAKFNSEYTHKPLSGTAKTIPNKNAVLIKEAIKNGRSLIKNGAKRKKPRHIAVSK